MSEFTDATIGLAFLVLAGFAGYFAGSVVRGLWKTWSFVSRLKWKYECPMCGGIMDERVATKIDSSPPRSYSRRCSTCKHVAGKAERNEVEDFSEWFL